MIKIKFKVTLYNEYKELVSKVIQATNKEAALNQFITLDLKDKNRAYMRDGKNWIGIKRVHEG
jgi:hypothetical protein